MWHLCKLLSRKGKLLLSFLCPGAGANCGLGVFHITAGRGVGTVSTFYMKFWFSRPFWGLETV